AHHWFGHKKTNLHVFWWQKLDNRISGCDPLALAIQRVEYQPAPRGGDGFLLQLPQGIRQRSTIGCNLALLRFDLLSARGERVHDERGFQLSYLPSARFRCSLRIDEVRFRDAPGMILGLIARQNLVSLYLCSVRLRALCLSDIDFRRALSCLQVPEPRLRGSQLMFSHAHLSHLRV